MMWRDIVELISVTETHSGDNVFQLTETSRTVFTNKKTVNRDEYYKALTNDLRPKLSFEIRSMEYSDEQKLRHNGLDYNIIRTYSRNDETVELICQAYEDVQTNLASLRDTIEIWKNVFVENSMGEMSPQPERVFTLPAHIEYVGGGSIDNGVENVIVANSTIKVTIKYRPNVSTNMFLKIDGNRYEIQRIDDPLNRHETLIITAERTVI
ncbi:phage head closure protein [Paenibacillus sp. FSL H7-0326]|uniref:phage head closure protein n=1 Tax=Paenibacillus sp. FSL H7-0326 TaxID=1921144 RepID=UPI00096C5C6C|nr:phage head closure protein [Paenibacillus sp. FSL H7-0326]